MAAARRAAYRALGAISLEQVELGEALRRFRDPLPDPRDRALATDLITGTLRWRGAIDFQLQRFSTKPLSRLDAEVLDALRLGAYQLLYLTRVPVSAAVTDAVDIVKSSRKRSAAGFANAVLRRVAEARTAALWPERPSQAIVEQDPRALVTYLSVVHSHPEWLVERWIGRYGAAAAEAWLVFNNQKPALTLAANRLRIDRTDLATKLAAESIDTIPTRVAPNGLTVVRGRALDSSSFRSGFCVVQDEASQIIPELVLAGPRHRVFDVCASPGGKTLALAAQAFSGAIVATDVRPRRVAILADTMRRCEPANVHVVHTSESGPLPFAEASFDRVLVDAPCSGLGTVRRDPDIKWRRRPEDLTALAALQGQLLTRVSAHVARGGRLIYSTCSSEPEENEAVVAAFLAGAPDFVRLSLPRMPALLPDIADMATHEGYLRTTPLDGLEAFFGAVLERRL